MRRRFLGALLLATVSLSAGEPDVRTLTLEEAIDLGLAYNLGLESQRLTALLERFQVAVEDAAWDPSLTSSVSIAEELTPSRSQLAGAALVDSDAFNVAAGVTKPFRLGPSLGIDWRTDRFFSNSTFSTINPAYDTALEISLTVPLLRGRGRRAQESALRSARAGAAAARHAQRDEAEGIIQAIADAFWNLLAFQRRVAVLEKSLQVAREIEDTERRKLRPEIGRSTRLDVTKAEAETKRREAALIEGRRDAANAADDLRALILPFTHDDGDAVVLRAVGVPEETIAVPPLGRLIDEALANRPDLKRTDADLRRREEAIVQAKDALRLQLDLTGGVSWKGVDGDFEDSAGVTLSGDNPSVNAALNLTWTFGRRAANAALRRAEMELERARIDRREQVNGIIVAVRKAHRELTTVMEQIEANREEVRSASDALDGERKRLGRGSATILDVSLLEENLTEAELSLLQSRLDLRRARVALQRATGLLLDHFGLSIGRDLDLKRS